MLQLLQGSAAFMVSLDIVGGSAAEDNAMHLYARATRMMDAGDLLLMGTFRDLITVFVGLARALKYQTEARLPECKTECAKCRQVCQHALDAMDQAPDPDVSGMDAMRVVLRYLSQLATGTEAAAEADDVLLRSASDEYLKALDAAIDAFEVAADVAAGTADPTLQGLRRMATEQVDRLSIRRQALNKPAPDGPEYAAPKGRKIFIVHGHDEARRLELKMLLKEEFNLDAIILAEQPGGGRTVIEKFEKFADETCYAFVLLTADDTVVQDGKQYWQPRPNVMFELGWFFGHLGPHRICLLKQQGTEIPSDLAGFLYLEFQKSIGEAYRDMKRELAAAGVVDQAKAMGSGV